MLLAAVTPPERTVVHCMQPASRKEVGGITVILLPPAVLVSERSGLTAVPVDLGSVMTGSSIQETCWAAGLDPVCRNTKIDDINCTCVPPHSGPDHMNQIMNLHCSYSKVDFTTWTNCVLSQGDLVIYEPDNIHDKHDTFPFKF